MKTYVAPSGTCESVAGTNAHIGFHGAYNPNSGVPGKFNIITATYLGYLGFSYEAVAWMLTPPPMAMYMLTGETAKQYGVPFETLDPPRAPSASYAHPPIPDDEKPVTASPLPVTAASQQPGREPPSRYVTDGIVQRFRVIFDCHRQGRRLLQRDREVFAARIARLAVGARSFRKNRRPFFPIGR